jgi:hypothetical protein
MRCCPNDNSTTRQNYHPNGTTILSMQSLYCCLPCYSNGSLHIREVSLVGKIGFMYKEYIHSFYFHMNIIMLQYEEL